MVNILEALRISNTRNYVNYLKSVNAKKLTNSAIMLSFLVIMLGLLGFNQVPSYAGSEDVSFSGYIFDVSGENGTGGTLPASEDGYSSTPILIGNPVNGSFGSASPKHTDGTYYTLYSFHGEAGQKISISMDSSDFDPYVELWDNCNPYTANVLLKDRGYATGETASLPEAGGYYTCPSTGTYYIFAGTYKAGSIGAYSLNLSGKTLSGVTLKFSAVNGNGTVPASVTTDSDGKWSQSGLMEGTTYRITPEFVNSTGTAYGFTPAYIDFVAGQDEIKQINFLCSYPNIKLQVPEAGKNLTGGDTWDLEWTHYGYIGDTVKVELYKGGTLISAKAGIPVGADGKGSYPFESSANLEAGNDYKLVVSSEKEGTICSESTFSVGASISLTSPMKSQEWATGQTNDITWTYAGNSTDNLKIDLIKGDPATSTSIVRLADSQSINSKSFSWAIPSTGITAGTDYRIRITRVDAGGLAVGSPVVSDSFTILESSFKVSGSLKEVLPTKDIYDGLHSSTIIFNEVKRQYLIQDYSQDYFRNFLTNSDGFYACAGQRIAIDLKTRFKAVSTDTTQYLVYINDKEVYYSSKDNSRFPEEGYYTIPTTGFYTVRIVQRQGSAIHPNYYICIETPPIEGVNLRFEKQQGNGSVPGTVKSDEKGLWSADFPSATTYRVIPEKEGYTFSPEFIEVSKASNPTDFNGYYNGIVSIDSPATNDIWYPGLEQTISWIYTGDIGDKVKLSLLKDGNPVDGISIPEVSAGAMGKGSCKWIVPTTLTPGTGYSIKVESSAFPQKNAISQSFTLGSNAIASGRIIAPPQLVSGGEAPNTGGKPVEPLRPGTFIKDTRIIVTPLNSGQTKSPYVVPYSGIEYISDKGYYFYGKAGQDLDVKFTSYRTDSRVCAVQSKSDGTLSIIGASDIIHQENKETTWKFTVPSDGTYMIMVLASPLAPELRYDLEVDMGIEISLKVENEKLGTLPDITTDSQGYWKIENLNGYKYRVTPSYPNCTFNPAFLELTGPGNAYNFSCIGPSMNVTAPCGGNNNWALRTSRDIKWNYTGALGQNVKIELLQGDTIVHTIADSVPIGSGKYTWMVPGDITAGKYKIKITSLEYDKYSAVSEFDVTNIMTLHTPLKTDAWGIGTVRNITWEYGRIETITYNNGPLDQGSYQYRFNQDIGDFVKLELLKNGSPLTELIAAQAPAGKDGKGSYTWTLPTNLEIGNDYQIRVSSVKYPNVSAMSEPFAIIGSYTASGYTELDYNGPVSLLEAKKSNIGPVGVPITVGQTIKGKLENSDYIRYNNNNPASIEDEYYLVIDKNDRVALELRSTSNVMESCPRALLSKVVNRKDLGLCAVCNSDYEPECSEFKNLDSGLYRIRVLTNMFSGELDYTLKVKSAVPEAKINFSVKEGEVKAPQAALSDKDGHWSRTFDAVAVYKAVAEKLGYNASPEQEINEPSDRINLLMNSPKSVPEITGITIDKSTGTFGQAQTITASITATGAADGTPVTVLLTATGGDSALYYLTKQIYLDGIVGEGTIAGGKAEIQINIPDALQSGYYKARAQIAGSTLMATCDYQIKMQEGNSAISTVEINPAELSAGIEQNVKIDVTTCNVENDKDVTAELINDDSTPLQASIKTTGKIKDNNAQLNLCLPQQLPADHYRVKITIAGLSQSILKPIVISNNAKQITGFTVLGQVGQTVIDSNAHTVTFRMPSGSKVAELIPTIMISPNASISPQSGVKQNFSSEVVYTVTAEDKSTQTWTAKCVLEPSVISASISPQSSSFKLDDPNDVSTNINWGSAKEVKGITCEGSETLNSNTDFTLMQDSLTIKKEYLSKLGIEEGKSKEFTIQFDKGNDATLKVEAVKNYTPSSIAFISDLRVNNKTVTDFVYDKYDYSIELPYGVQLGSQGTMVTADLQDTKAKMIITQATQLPGKATVKVTAEDNKTTQEYTINFTLKEPTNNAPKRKTGVPATASQSVIVNSPYTLNLSTIFEDVDNNPLTYKVVVNGETPVKAEEDYSYTPKAEGITKLVFSANDGKNDSAETYTVTITASFKQDIPDSQGNGSSSGGGGGGSTFATEPNNPNEMQIPVKDLSGIAGKVLEIKTQYATLFIPSNMLTSEMVENAKFATIVVSKADTSKLPSEITSQIGNRPVIEIVLKLDGKIIQWNNPNAPVKVSIPYKPTAEELKDPEHIIIWYIDGSGKAVSVPSGRYDASTGKVTFTTTHFSNYAVAYVEKSFADISTVSWAKKQIEVLASKDIIRGTAGATGTISDASNNFAPKTNITRADFLYSLIKTLGVDAKIDGAFDDISKDAYYYKELAVARNLGIATGTGNNCFNPDANITRQDMMTLTARVLEKYKDLEAESNTAVLDKFSDKTSVAGYAAPSMASLVKEGLITGDGSRLNPKGQTTRAEAAVFLYRIYNKY